MNEPPIIFEAEIRQHGDINAAYVDFPFSVEDLFGTKGQVKIKAKFDGGTEYRGSLAKMGGSSHRLGLTQEIRKKLGKSFGDTVAVALWQDKDQRIVEIPDDVQQVFNENQVAFGIYQKMSYTHQKEYMRWITEAKKPETRENRKIKMIEMLLAGKKGV